MAEFEDKLSSILGNEAAMGQIMALAQSISGGSTEEHPHESEPQPRESAPQPRESAPQGGDPFSMLADIDPKMIQMGMRLFQEYRGEDNKNAALLAAIRPFIREERYGKLDRAMQLAKISRVIRVLMSALGKKGEDLDV